ncbi:calmodulin [Eurytemora carolleeae]|uniref:calmodulin n=1 Tax=Eurytemora carolleeae TaxID=1294199 RepID=UPI000C76C8B0|nr:calmodulin [Eurytemora carolleeae]|eukprot:XP_023325721.1 calmodulin-like [Eurytemora affinis]
MRRAGQNPTDVEVQDLLNNIDNGSGTIDFEDFLVVMREKVREIDLEIHFKDTFRVFSKDEDGCIPADELKFVMNHLPGKINYKEIEEMIETVDRNGDGRISYSEFR